MIVTERVQDLRSEKLSVVKILFEEVSLKDQPVCLFFFFFN